MPQMAPMNWVSLYFIFITVFMIFIVLNYFSFLYNPNKTQMSKKKMTMNWKW